ncbi:MAG: group II intron maturase-specific domain-containing protein, partial [Syntrophorhabdales bacterium]
RGATGNQRPRGHAAPVVYSTDRARKRTKSSNLILVHLTSDSRDWGNFYRFCIGAKTILNDLDWYVGDRVWRWMTRKYPKAGARQLLRFRRRVGGQRVWCDGKEKQFLIERLKDK